MRPIYPAILATALLTAAAPALAATAKLDAVQIKGVTSVPVDELQASLPHQAGARVSVPDDAYADEDALEKALTKYHVGGSIKASLVDKHNGHVEFVYDVTDQGIQKPVTVTTAPVLQSQTFVGNTKVDAATLAAASGLQPGAKLTDQVIKDAQSKIAHAYDGKGVSVNVQGSIAQSGPTVQITWNVTETKAKKKKIPAWQQDFQGGTQADDISSH